MTHEQALDLVIAMVGQHNDKAPELRAAMQAVSRDLAANLCQDWHRHLRLTRREQLDPHWDSEQAWARWYLGKFLVEWGEALQDALIPGPGVHPSPNNAELLHKAEETIEALRHHLLETRVQRDAARSKRDAWYGLVMKLNDEINHLCLCRAALELAWDTWDEKDPQVRADAVKKMEEAIGMTKWRAMRCAACARLFADAGDLLSATPVESEPSELASYEEDE